jgi:enamine deaminase RidA (YjgF/YER057c/UK114 family)
MDNMVPGFRWVAKENGTIYLAGQVGITSTGTIPDGLEDQVRQAFENIRESLALAGAGPSSIIQMMLFLKAGSTAPFMEDFEIVVKAKEEILPGAVPVGTAMRVTELFLPTVLFEAQVIAVSP